MQYNELTVFRRCSGTPHNFIFYISIKTPYSCIFLFLTTAFVSDVCKTEEGKQICEVQRRKNLKALYTVLCRERSENDSMDIIREILALLKQLRVQEDMLSHYWDKFFQDYEHVNFPKCFADVYKK